MSTEVLTMQLAAGVKSVAGAGSMFLLVAAPGGAVSIVARQIGNSNAARTFTNVPAGFKFKADSATDGFDTLEITSAANQSIQLALGNDDVTFSNAVTVSGTVSTEELPTGTAVDQAGPALANAAQTLVFPVNVSRRSIGVSFGAAAAIAPGQVYFRAHGGANNLMEVQAGQVYTFRGTYALDVYNNSGAALTPMLFEEQ